MHQEEFILLTGSTGFIGQQLLRSLRVSGRSVICLNRVPNTKAYSLDFPDKTSVVLDDLDFFHLAEALSPYNVTDLVHCATLFRSHHDSLDVTPILAANVTLGALLLEWCCKTGSRFLNLSSYWQWITGTASASFYLQSKKMFESLIDYYIDNRKVVGASLVVTDTYGSGDKRQKLVPILLGSAQSGRVVQLSCRTNEILLTNVSDVLVAISKILEAAKWRRYYRADNFEPVSLQDIVSAFDVSLTSELKVEWGSDCRGLIFDKSFDVMPWPENYSPQVHLLAGISSVAHNG